MIDIYHKKYYQTIEELHINKKFIGKEQTNMLITILKYPEIIRIVDHSNKNWLYPFQSDPWFYMLILYIYDLIFLRHLLLKLIKEYRIKFL